MFKSARGFDKIMASLNGFLGETLTEESPVSSFATSSLLQELQKIEEDNSREPTRTPMSVVDSAKEDSSTPGTCILRSSRFTFTAEEAIEQYAQSSAKAAKEAAKAAKEAARAAKKETTKQHGVRHPSSRPFKNRRLF